MQLGHAGAKGSTRVPWEGEDQPLDSGNWPLISASPQQYLDGVSDWSRAMTRADMDRVDGATSSARRASPPRPASTGSSCTARTATCSRRSSRRSPTSAPTSTAARSRTACAIRSRSSTRCARSGRSTCRSRCGSRRTTGSRAASRPTTRSRSRAPSRPPAADLIDCSSGQVSKKQQPVYGRMYQTPFADRIRNEAGIPTIAVGAISEADHVNSIIAAGRADLCAVARPHLANPAWTLARRSGSSSPDAHGSADVERDAPRGSAQWIRFPRVVCERWVHHEARRAGRLRRRRHTAHLDRLDHRARGSIELARSIGRPAICRRRCRLESARVEG